MADTFNFSLRMPIELGEFIYEMSKTNRRPMNSQIILLLEAAIKEKNRKKSKSQILQDKYIHSDSENSK